MSNVKLGPIPWKLWSITWSSSAFLAIALLGTTSNIPVTVFPLALALIALAATIAAFVFRALGPVGGSGILARGAVGLGVGATVMSLMSLPLGIRYIYAVVFGALVGVISGVLSPPAVAARQESGEGRKEL